MTGSRRPSGNPPPHAPVPARPGGAVPRRTAAALAGTTSQAAGGQKGCHRPSGDPQVHVYRVAHMGRDPRHDILFEPVEIGPKTLRNRFYQVPHCTGFGNGKPYSQAHHRAVKAEGGWAAVCTEYAAVSPDSDEAPFAHIRVWDEGDRAHIGLMAEQAHAAGALAGIELFHSGAHGHNADSHLPTVAPSQIASDYNGFVPRAMTKADIRRVQAEWVRAAELSRDAGYDIVYAYGAHTYLL